MISFCINCRSYVAGDEFISKNAAAYLTTRLRYVTSYITTYLLQSSTPTSTFTTTRGKDEHVPRSSAPYAPSTPAELPACSIIFYFLRGFQFYRKKKRKKSKFTEALAVALQCTCCRRQILSDTLLSGPPALSLATLIDDHRRTSMAGTVNQRY